MIMFPLRALFFDLPLYLRDHLLEHLDDCLFGLLPVGALCLPSPLDLGYLLLDACPDDTVAGRPLFHLGTDECLQLWEVPCKTCLQVLNLVVADSRLETEV